MSGSQDPFLPLAHNIDIVDDHPRQSANIPHSSGAAPNGECIAIQGQAEAARGRDTADATTSISAVDTRQDSGQLSRNEPSSTEIREMMSQFARQPTQPGERSPSQVGGEMMLTGIPTSLPKRTSSLGSVPMHEAPPSHNMSSVHDQDLQEEKLVERSFPRASHNGGGDSFTRHVLNVNGALEAVPGSTQAYRVSATSTTSQDSTLPSRHDPVSPFDFQRFLEQLRHRTADPVAKFLRSFLVEFGKKQWMVHEQVKIVGDFLSFIAGKMAQCEIWSSVSEAEFDNAKEGMEKLVMNRLYSQTFSPVIPPARSAATLPDDKTTERRSGFRRQGQHQEDVERDEVLAQKTRIYQWVREPHLDIPVVGDQGRRFLSLAQQGE